MNKSDVITAFLLLFQTKLQQLEKSQYEAIVASEEAPSRNEARYDSSKDDFAHMAAVIHEQITQTQLFLKYLKKLEDDPSSILLVEAKAETIPVRWYFVSELPGGEKINIDGKEVISIGKTTPLGTLFANAPKRMFLKLNTTVWTIVSVL